MLSKSICSTFGEITLIVIGILIALQINNWNEWRKARNTEQELLYDLQENLEFNTHALEQIISILKNEDNSSEIIISTLKNKKSFHDSLEVHFARALDPTTEIGDELSYVGYEAMKNIGFNTIVNDQLKKEIIRLFELTYSASEGRHNLVTQYLPNVQNLVHERLMRRPEGWRYAPFNFESLVEDTKFLSWLYTLKNNRGWVRESFETSLSETRKVLQLINEDLAE